MREFTEYTDAELSCYMGEAYAEAEKAYEKNEIPVGCVIVWDKQIVARAHKQFAVVERQLHAMVESAGKEKVVVGLEDELVRPAEVVV